MKVNASAIRAGNVIELNGQLYVVLTADNIKPGKGAPVTQIDARRISDGIKTSERFRTTEQVERAFIEEATYTFLFADGDQFTFMHPETFEQLAVPKDVIGDAAVYLADGMEVSIKSHEGRPVASELPQRVTLEVTETEPVVKGQTASGSFKPALLANGVRTMVPTHITVGARIVVMTADGSYVERAKD